MVVGGMAMLEEVAKAGDINGLYPLLRECQKLLEVIDLEPFVDTPLHGAASAGHTHFALEILRLKPSFGRKLNPDGLSPILLALRNGHINTVKRLIKYDPELIRVQGREGITPLHYLVSDEFDENIHLLAEFLIKCPASIRCTTIRDETALHLAIKNRKLDSFKVLHGWLCRTDKDYVDGVLYWKDENGNSALHLAVSTNQPEMLQPLIRGPIFSKNDVNEEGDTVMDIAKRFPQHENEKVRKILKLVRAAESSSVPPPETLAPYLSSKWYTFQEMILRCDVYLQKGLSGEMRNALLVVAVLIATATYQAILQPPSGISQGDQNQPPSSLIPKSTAISSIDHSSKAGKVVIPETHFYPFFIVNSTALAASLGIIIALLPGYFSSLLLYLPLVFMFGSYVASGFFISPAKVTRYIIVLAIPTLVFVIILVSKLWCMNWEVITLVSKLGFMNREVITNLVSKLMNWEVITYKRQQLRRSVYNCRYSQ